MGMSVQAAAVGALQGYLQAEFNAVYDPNLRDERVQVLDGWPDSGVKLPQRAVTILMAGERQDTHLEAEVVRRADAPDGVTAEYTFAIKSFTQPLQLDVFAKYDAIRDQLCADLDKFLHKGPRYTLGLARGELVRDGILLKLEGEDHQSSLDFTFEGPRNVNDGAGHQESEYRAMIRASVDGELTVKATTAKLARVKVQAILDRDPASITLQPIEGRFVPTAIQL